MLYQPEVYEHCKTTSLDLDISKLTGGMKYPGYSLRSPFAEARIRAILASALQAPDVSYPTSSETLRSVQLHLVFLVLARSQVGYMPHTSLNLPCW